MQILKNPNFDFLGKARVFIAVSLLVILGGAALIARQGLRYGVEFQGGTQLIVKFQNTPQVDEIRFNLAIHLLNGRRFSDAAQILGPIAYSPHGGDTAARARRYLEAAQRGEMPEW